MAVWLTVADVKLARGIDPSGPADEAWAASVTAACNALVNRLRPDLADTGTPATSPDVYQGALELAQKVYASRGATDDGTGLDVYSYAARYIDANVMLLLGIDRPVVA